MRDILSDLGDMLSDPDPVRRAQIQMKKPLPKRFYTTVSTRPAEGGIALTLDGKTLKTPGKRDFTVPTQALADIVAAEWDAQVDIIDPGKMPVTRLVNSALDGVATQMQAVADEIIRYAGNDMLCYRADAPAELVHLENSLWNPVLDWAREALGAQMVLIEGIIHRDQPARSMDAVARAVMAYDEPVKLASLNLITTLTGSALLALAFAHGRLSADEVWKLAHVDEDYNIELWGSDFEAEARRKHRHIDFQAAASAFLAA